MTRRKTSPERGLKVYRPRESKKPRVVFTVVGSLRKELVNNALLNTEMRGREVVGTLSTRLRD